MSVADTKIAFQGTSNVFPQTEEIIRPINAAEKIFVSSITKFLFKYGKKKRYSKGQYIIREGHEDKTVFIILSGQVEILKKDKNENNKVVTQLTGGGIILGEMSIFLDEPRSSSVRISKETLALEFTGENFLNAVANIPELSMRILKCLSNKLKGTNERVVHNNVCDSCKEKSGKPNVEGTGEGIK